jgi:hypothetical protein
MSNNEHVTQQSSNWPRGRMPFPGSTLALFIISLNAFAQEAPPTMKRLTVHFQSPEISESSFAAKPKTIYRAGNRYCRTEELPDDEHGIHGLRITNEPDTWMVNLFTMKAQHYVDSGPTFNCKMPIFIFGQDIKSTADLKNPLFELEFGHEIEYFEAEGAMRQQGPVLQGKPTNAYVVDVADSHLILFTAETPQRPLAVARQRRNARDVFWYDTYEERTFDPKLFARPTDVKIEDARP